MIPNMTCVDKISSRYEKSKPWDTAKEVILRNLDEDFSQYTEENHADTLKFFKTLGYSKDSSLNLQAIPSGERGKPVKLNLPTSLVWNRQSTVLNQYSNGHYNIYARYNYSKANEDVVSGLVDVVAEFDDVDLADQIDFAAKVPLLPTAVVFSGRRSLQFHNILRVENCPNSELKKLVKDYCKLLKKADPRAAKLNQAFRVPGYRHAKNGNFAKVVYQSGKVHTFDDFRQYVPTLPAMAFDLRADLQEPTRQLWSSNILKALQDGGFEPTATRKGFSDYSIPTELGDVKIWVNTIKGDWNTYYKSEEGSEGQYYDAVVETLGLTLIKKVIPFKREMPKAVKVNQRYLDIQLVEQDNVFIRSATGTGKTTSALEFKGKIEKKLGRKIRVLTISARVGLTYSQNEKWETEHYMDAGVDFTSENGVTICLNSLPRIPNEILERFDLVIFDEIEQTLDNLINSTTISESNRVRIRSKIELLMKREDCCKLYLDASLDPATVAYVEAITGREAYILDNSYTSDGLVYLYPRGKNSENLWQNRLFNALKEGKRVAFLGETATKAKTLIEKVKAEMPEINTVEITGETTHKDEIKNILKNVNASLEAQNIQFLSASPSVDTGISIDLKHFDIVFGYYCGVNSDASLALQQMNRVRDRSVERHIYVEDSPKNLPEDSAQTIQEVLIRVDQVEFKGDDVIKGVYGIHLQYDLLAEKFTYNENDTPYIEYVAERIAKSNRSRNQIRKSIIEVLKMEGYRIEPVEVPEEVEEKFSKAEQRALLQVRDYAEAELVSQSETISEEEAERIKTDYHRTEEQVRQLKKYYASQTLAKPQPTTDEIMVWSEGRLAEKIYITENLLNPDLLKYREEELEKKRTGEESAQIQKARSYVVETELLNQLGVTELVQKLVREPDTRLTGDDLKALGELAFSRKNRVKAILRVNLDRAKATERAYLNTGKKILEKILPGLDTIKVGKKNERFYVLNFDSQIWKESFLRREQNRIEKDQAYELRKSNFEMNQPVYVKTKEGYLDGYRVTRFANINEGETYLSVSSGKLDRAVYVENPEKASLIRVAISDIYTQLPEEEQYRRLGIEVNSPEYFKHKLENNQF